MINFDKNKRYLFVCAFGQSRSRYFAEMFMKNGFMAIFCGYDSEADIVISKELVEWSDEIILLDKNNIKCKWLNHLLEGKNSFNFFIEDIPTFFQVEFEKFLNIYRFGLEVRKKSE